MISSRSSSSSPSTNGEDENEEENNSSNQSSRASSTKRSNSSFVSLDNNTHYNNNNDQSYYQNNNNNKSTGGNHYRDKFHSNHYSQHNNNNNNNNSNITNHHSSKNSSSSSNSHQKQPSSSSKSSSNKLSNNYHQNSYTNHYHSYHNHHNDSFSKSYDINSKYESSSSSHKKSSSSSSKYSTINTQHQFNTNTNSSSNTNNVTNSLKFNDPLRVLKIKNLPSRAQIPSLKENLYDEFVKYGRIIYIRIEGEGDKKVCYIFYKRSQQAKQAHQELNEKQFLNQTTLKIEIIDSNQFVQSFYPSDQDSNLNDANTMQLIANLKQDEELDEYCTKATRTLYIGNLDRDVRHSDLREKLDKKYGDIIEIEIKKDNKSKSSSSGSASGSSSNNNGSYAFIQFSDIKSVIKAMRCMSGKCIGNNLIKLGFGKSKPTRILWLDGIEEQLKETQLLDYFNDYCENSVEQILIDRVKCQGLVYFNYIEDAKLCLDKIRAKRFYEHRIMADFASKEFISSRFEHLLDPKHHLFNRFNVNANSNLSPNPTESTISMDSGDETNKNKNRNAQSKNSKTLATSKEIINSSKYSSSSSKKEDLSLQLYSNDYNKKTVSGCNSRVSPNDLSHLLIDRESSPRNKNNSKSSHSLNSPLNNSSSTNSNKNNDNSTKYSTGASNSNSKYNNNNYRSSYSYQDQYYSKNNNESPLRNNNTNRYKHEENDLDYYKKNSSNSKHESRKSNHYNNNNSSNSKTQKNQNDHKNNHHHYHHHNSENEQEETNKSQNKSVSSISSDEIINENNTNNNNNTNNARSSKRDNKNSEKIKNKKTNRKKSKKTTSANKIKNNKNRSNSSFSNTSDSSNDSSTSKASKKISRSSSSSSSKSTASSSSSASTSFNTSNSSILFSTNSSSNEGLDKIKNGKKAENEKPTKDKEVIEKMDIDKSNSNLKIDEGKREELSKNLEIKTEPIVNTNKNISCVSNSSAPTTPNQVKHDIINTNNSNHNTSIQETKSVETTPQPNVSSSHPSSSSSNQPVRSVSGSSLNKSNHHHSHKIPLESNLNLEDPRFNKTTNDSNDYVNRIRHKIAKILDSYDLPKFINANNTKINKKKSLEQLNESVEKNILQTSNIDKPSGTLSCSSSTSSLDRRSLDERIKMLDEMMDKQQQQQPSKTCKTASNESVISTTICNKSINSVTTTPITTTSTTCLKLNSKLFELDEKRLQHSNSSIQIPAPSLQSPIASTVTAAVCIKDKFSNSPLFSKTSSSASASATITPTKTQNIIPSLNLAQKQSPNLENNPTATLPTTPTPSTPTSVQIAEKLGLKIKAHAATPINNNNNNNNNINNNNSNNSCNSPSSEMITVMTTQISNSNTNSPMSSPVMKSILKHSISQNSSVNEGNNSVSPYKRSPSVALVSNELTKVHNQITSPLVTNTIKHELNEQKDQVKILSDIESIKTPIKNNAENDIKKIEHIQITKPIVQAKSEPENIVKNESKQTPIKLTASITPDINKIKKEPMEIANKQSVLTTKDKENNDKVSTNPVSKPALKIETKNSDSIKKIVKTEQISKESSSVKIENKIKPIANSSSSNKVSLHDTKKSVSISNNNNTNNKEFKNDTSNKKSTESFSRSKKNDLKDIYDSEESESEVKHKLEQHKKKIMNKNQSNKPNTSETNRKADEVKSNKNSIQSNTGKIKQSESAQKPSSNTNSNLNKTNDKKLAKEGTKPKTTTPNSSVNIDNNALKKDKESIKSSTNKLMNKQTSNVGSVSTNNVIKKSDSDKNNHKKENKLNDLTQSKKTKSKDSKSKRKDLVSSSENSDENDKDAENEKKSSENSDEEDNDKSKSSFSSTENPDSESEESSSSDSESNTESCNDEKRKKKKILKEKLKANKLMTTKSKQKSSSSSIKKEMVKKHKTNTKIQGLKRELAYLVDPKTFNPLNFTSMYDRVKARPRGDLADEDEKKKKKRRKKKKKKMMKLKMKKQTAKGNNFKRKLSKLEDSNESELSKSDHTSSQSSSSSSSSDDSDQENRRTSSSDENNSSRSASNSNTDSESESESENSNSSSSSSLNSSLSENELTTCKKTSSKPLKKVVENEPKRRKTEDSTTKTAKSTVSRRTSNDSLFDSEEVNELANKKQIVKSQTTIAKSQNSNVQIQKRSRTDSNASTTSNISSNSSILNKNNNNNNNINISNNKKRKINEESDDNATSSNKESLQMKIIKSDKSDALVSPTKSTASANIKKETKDSSIEIKTNSNSSKTMASQKEIVKAKDNKLISSPIKNNNNNLLQTSKNNTKVEDKKSNEKSFTPKPSKETSQSKTTSSSNNNVTNSTLQSTSSSKPPVTNNKPKSININVNNKKTELTINNSLKSSLSSCSSSSISVNEDEPLTLSNIIKTESKNIQNKLKSSKNKEKKNESDIINRSNKKHLVSVSHDEETENEVDQAVKNIYAATNKATEQQEATNVIIETNENITTNSISLVENLKEETKGEMEDIIETEQEVKIDLNVKNEQEIEKFEDVKRMEEIAVSEEIKSIKQKTLVGEETVENETKGNLEQLNEKSESNLNSSEILAEIVKQNVEELDVEDKFVIEKTPKTEEKQDEANRIEENHMKNEIGINENLIEEKQEQPQIQIAQQEQDDKIELEKEVEHKETNLNEIEMKEHIKQTNDELKVDETNETTDMFKNNREMEICEPVEQENDVEMKLTDEYSVEAEDNKNINKDEILQDDIEINIETVKPVNAKLLEPEESMEVGERPQPLNTIQDEIESKIDQVESKNKDNSILNNNNIQEFPEISPNEQAISTSNLSIPSVRTDSSEIANNLDSNNSSNSVKNVGDIIQLVVASSYTIKEESVLNDNDASKILEDCQREDKKEEVLSSSLPKLESFKIQDQTAINENNNKPENNNLIKIESFTTQGQFQKDQLLPIVSKLNETIISTLKDNNNDLIMTDKPTSMKSPISNNQEIHQLQQKMQSENYFMEMIQKQLQQSSNLVLPQPQQQTSSNLAASTIEPVKNVTLQPATPPAKQQQQQQATAMSAVKPLNFNNDEMTRLILDQLNSSNLLINNELGQKNNKLNDFAVPSAKPSSSSSSSSSTVNTNALLEQEIIKHNKSPLFNTSSAQFLPPIFQPPTTSSSSSSSSSSSLLPNQIGDSSWQEAYSKYPLPFLAPPQFQNNKESNNFGNVKNPIKTPPPASQSPKTPKSQNNQMLPTQQLSTSLMNEHMFTNTFNYNQNNSDGSGPAYLDRIKQYEQLISSPITPIPQSTQQASIQQQPLKKQILEQNNNMLKQQAVYNNHQIPQTQPSTTPKFSSSSLKQGKKQLAKEYEQQQQLLEQQQMLLKSQQQPKQLSTPNNVIPQQQNTFNNDNNNNNINKQIQGPDPLAAYYSALNELGLPPSLLFQHLPHELQSHLASASQQQIKNSANNNQLDFMSQLMMLANLHQNENKPQQHQLANSHNEFLAHQLFNNINSNGQPTPHYNIDSHQNHYSINPAGCFLNESNSFYSSDNYQFGFTEFQDPSKIIWTGSFTMKNDTAQVAMNFVSGNMDVAHKCLTQMTIDSKQQQGLATTRILQRMRLEKNQLEGVQRKLDFDNEHCILLAVPYGNNQLEQMTQTSSLRNCFINYLLEKRAAGIVNVSIPQSNYVVHIFPPCDFTFDLLRNRAPDLIKRLGDYTHLFIVIATS